MYHISYVYKYIYIYYLINNSKRCSPCAPTNVYKGDNGGRTSFLDVRQSKMLAFIGKLVNI